MNIQMTVCRKYRINRALVLGVSAKMALAAIFIEAAICSFSPHRALAEAGLTAQQSDEIKSKLAEIDRNIQAAVKSLDDDMAAGLKELLSKEITFDSWKNLVEYIGRNHSDVVKGMKLGEPTSEGGLKLWFNNDGIPGNRILTGEKLISAPQTFAQWQNGLQKDSFSGLTDDGSLLCFLRGTNTQKQTVWLYGLSVPVVSLVLENARQKGIAVRVFRRGLKSEHKNGKIVSGDPGLDAITREISPGGFPLVLVVSP